MDLSDLADAHEDRLEEEHRVHWEKVIELADKAMSDHKLMLILTELAGAHEDDTMDWIGREYVESLTTGTIPKLESRLYNMVLHWADEHYDEAVKLVL